MQDKTAFSAEAETVLICGALSEMCVSATARGALARQLKVVIAHDAHGSHDVPGLDDGAAS